MYIGMGDASVSTVAVLPGGGIQGCVGASAVSNPFGLLPSASQLATDAQAAAITGQSGAVPPIMVGSINNSTGQLSVLLPSSVAATFGAGYSANGFSFINLGTLPASILSSVGVTGSSPTACQESVDTYNGRFLTSNLGYTSLNHAQTVAVLSALVAAGAKQSGTLASSTGTVASSTTPLGIPLWGWAAAAGAVVLLFLTKGK